MRVCIEWGLLITIIILIVIFFSNAVVALMSRETKAPYQPDWVIKLGGFALGFLILLSCVLLMVVQDLREEIKNPVQYELVREPLYRIK